MLFDPTDLPDPPKVKPKKIPPTATRSEIKAKQKEKRLAGRFQQCGEVLGPIRQGYAYHLASMGAWSAHDVIRHCLDYTGPASLHFTSWSISDSGLRVLVEARKSGLLTSIHALADVRFMVHNPEAQGFLLELADEFRHYPSHAKVYVLRNKKWGVAIVGSANLTTNPRIECSVITVDKEIADFHISWITQVIEKADPFEANKPGEADGGQ